MFMYNLLIGNKKKQRIEDASTICEAIKDKLNAEIPTINNQPIENHAITTEAAHWASLSLHREGNQTGHCKIEDDQNKTISYDRKIEYDVIANSEILIKDKIAIKNGCHAKQLHIPSSKPLSTRYFSASKNVELQWTAKLFEKARLPQFEECTGTLTAHNPWAYDTKDDSTYSAIIDCSSRSNEYARYHKEMKFNNKGERTQSTSNGLKRAKL